MKAITKRASLLARAALAAMCLLILVPVSLQAQELRGKISGRVLDPNGAAVPGATVKVVNVARNTTENLTSNDDGVFDAPYLLPGTYQVLVEITGFKKVLRDNVDVAINQTTTLEIKLDVGSPQETVTVTAEIPPLNVSDPNLGQTIDRKRVDELPSVHGDPYHLMNLTPGVAYTGSTRLDRPFEPTHIANFAMSGARGIRSDLLIDGAPSTATANANEVIASYVPTTDATEEFRVQTATYDAQFGNTEGGVTSIVTKGGTNNYHGTAYLWTEPAGMSANDFFGNLRGQGRPFSYSNRPGFSIGGPISIPKLYNGKNRSFFFFAFEQIADSRPRFDAPYQNTWAPTQALANGDFSAYLGRITIYDPLTGTSAGANRTAFTNNIIPAGRINPVARAVVTYLGSPLHAAQGTSLLTGNNTDSTLAEVLAPAYRNYTMRFDHNFSDKDRVFGRYSWYNRTSSYNNITGGIYVGDRFLFISKQGMVDGVHTFNANTVLNVRYGFNRFIRGSDAPEGQYGLDLTTLGFPASYNNAIGEGIRRFPSFAFTCTGCTGATLGNAHNNEFRPVSSHFATAVLNRSEGKHSLRFGGEMRIYREDDSFRANNQSGAFTFDNTYTRQNFSPSGNDVEGLQAFAAFLLGYPSAQTIVRATDYSEYSKTFGFFFQDDFHVTSKLTLNLGLRYEFEQPLFERQNKSVSGFDLAYTQPFQGQAQTNFANVANIPANDVLRTTYGLTSITARGGLLFAGKDTGSALYQTPKNGFLPRAGFAYQWNDKTVIRGGFGLYQGFLGERRGDAIQPGYTQTTTQAVTTGPTGAPLPFLISNPFPSGITEPSGNSLGRQTALGQNVTFFNQNPKVAKHARWSIGIQRELSGWVFEATYLGDNGYDIEINRNLNAQPLNTLNTDSSRTVAQNTNNTNLSANVRNPFCTGTPTSCTTPLFTGAGVNISRRQLLLPFPNFGSITTTNNDGKSWYHSAQFSMNKRFSKGWGVQAAYTFSKWIQQTEYLNAADALPTKMISDQDVPHRFSASAFYEFPFGHGQRWGAHENGWVNALIGGWQIQGTYAYQSGFPVVFGSDLFYLGGEVALPRSQQTITRWFNTNAFVNAATGNPLPTCGAAPGGSANCATPVDHLRTFPLRLSNVRLDRTNNVDLGLRKDIRINETMRIQLRMEFINAFNTPLLTTLSGNAPSVAAGATAFGGFASAAISQQNYPRRAQLLAKFIF